MKKSYLLIALWVLILSYTSLTGQNTDYQQIILYGQSLGLGWESPRAITTTSLNDNYMLGSHVNSYYTTEGTTLTPLISKKTGPVGEQPIVSCLNAFSQAYRTNINANQKFIAFAGGWGGQSIEKLSKESTNGENYYDTTFLKYLDNTLTAINGSTVSCPAIIYMQGEHNSSVGRVVGLGLTTGTNATLDKNIYKNLLLTLKNNMQADIMAKYNQAEKPMFFIYQTSGGYITLKEMPVVMAQIEFAEENNDVVLLNPHYAMPDYNRGHMSTNGYRWYGEYLAKSLVKELVTNVQAKTLKATNFNVVGQKITIDYDVPVSPLVLDTWTTPMQNNYGFEVYKNGSVVNITSVNIVNDVQVEITCDVLLTGKIEIVYAGNTTEGSGNLRDSDNGTISMYTYFNDSGDSLQESYTPTTLAGVKIYGQNYGLQNWSNMFYYDLNPEITLNIGETFIDGDYEYTVTSVDPNEVEVSDFAIAPGIGQIANLIIPATALDDSNTTYSVTAIGFGAFSANTREDRGGGNADYKVVETVSLPTSVKTIGAHAFRETNLTTINLNNIVEIGSNCFVTCTSLVDIGSLSSLITLGGYAFYQCHALTFYELPSTITNYPTGSIYDMDGITSFNIPSTVTEIGPLFLGRNDNITAIQANWLNPTTDVTISSTNFFRDLYETDGSIKNTIKLYVPIGTKTLYENHPLLGLFPNSNIIEGTLSANVIKSKLRFDISPNPVKGIIVIKNIDLRNISMTLFDLSGSSLLTKKLNSLENRIDVSNLSSGIYLIEIRTDNSKFIQRIVKP